MVNIAESLGASESGNNPDAYRVNKDGRDMTGKYQFSRGRLKDLGMGSIFTYEQFRDDDEIQEWVFNKHIEDIDRFIDDNNLDQFIGQEISGQTMTRSGMQAMAHLGGKGGMQKFLQSNGGYNPSDELGTSLLDYASKHGGVTGPRRSTLPEGHLVHENMEARKPRAANLDSPLYQFGGDMLQASTQLGSTIGMLGEGQTMMHDIFAAQLSNTKPSEMAQELRFSSAIPKADAGVGGATPLGFGSDVPAIQKEAAAGFLPKQLQPTLGTNSGGAGAGVGDTFAAPPSVAGGKSKPAEDDEAGFMMNALRKIMPNAADDETRRMAGGDILAALSTGLGQMSGGSDVNLNPVFNRIAARNQAAASAESDAQKQYLDGMRIQNEVRRLQLDEAKHNVELAQLNLANTPGGGIFAPETMAMYASDPATAPFVEMIGSPDEETRKEGVTGLRQVLQKKAEAELEEESGNKDLGPLFEAVARDAEAPEIAQILSDGGYSPEALNAVYRNLGKTPESLIKQAEMYDWAQKNDPDLARSMEQIMQRTAGLDETPRERAARENYYKNQEAMDGRVTKGAGLFAELDTMERTTKEMVEEGEESGVLNPIITSIGSGLRQLFGEDALTLAGSAVGLDSGTISRLENLVGSEATLALMIAGPLMEGGGSISDGERAMMLKTVASGNTSHATRLQMIGRLKQLHLLDKAVADGYAARVEEDGYESGRRHKRALENDASSLLPEFRRASVEHANAMNPKILENQRYMDMDESEVYRRVSPTMTAEQYKTFGAALPDTKGAKYWLRLNADGTRTQMKNGKVWREDDG